MHGHSAILRSYENNNRRKLQSLLASYQGLSSLSEAITKAAHALDEKGNRHRHQARIKRAVILAAHEALDRTHAQLGTTHDFETLHTIIETSTLRIKGIGPLYVYDAALRLGAYLRIEPTKVYLHAGTRKGATRLGVPLPAEAISPEALPPEFSHLKAHEIEDLLCIYKDRL